MGRGCKGRWRVREEERERMERERGGRDDGDRYEVEREVEWVGAGRVEVRGWRVGWVRLGWERRVGGGCDGCGEELVAGGSEGKVGGSSLPS